MDVELTSNELSALMSRLKATKSALENHLYLFLDDNLLCLVELEVSEGISPLSCVPARLRSKWCHLV